MRLENEERFVLDDNNLILDMEDTRQKYNLEPEEICELLNKQEKEIKKLKEERIVKFYLDPAMTKEWHCTVHIAEAEFKKQFLKELEVASVKKCRQRPKDLYFKDALWEVYLELDKELNK